MNQCLENPPVDEVTPAPETAGGAIVGRGRVLLLDDDAAFEGIIQDFLVENGFTVVAVQNGRDGIEAVMGGDFALILCDISMPTMPGDMFYRAVERIRPDLCECFIFMTGYRGDASKSDFIKSINGYVLPKPFALKDLLDSIALTEVRRTFRSVFEAGETAPRPAHVSPPADPYLAKALLLRDPEGVAEEPEPALLAPEVFPSPAAATAAVVPPAPVDLAVRHLPATLRGSSPRSHRLPITVGGKSASQPRAGAVSRWFAVAGLVLFLVAAVLLTPQYREARDRAVAAEAERRATEEKWQGVSEQLEHAEKLRSWIASLPGRLAEARNSGGSSETPRAEAPVAGLSKFESAPSQVALIAADRARPRWTSALRGIVTVAGEAIELLEISTREVPEDSGACDVRVHGSVGGAQPRLEADRFRQALEERLKKDAHERPVSTRMERLEDVPGALPGQQRATFEITATVGRANPPTAAKGEGR